MKRSAAFVVGIAMAASTVSISSRTPQPKLIITIQTEQAAYTIGEPVLLDIVFSNLTPAPIYIWRSPGVQPGSRQGELYSDVYITRSGEPLQPTAYEINARAGQALFVSRVLDTAKGGKNVKDAMTLNKLFDLNKAGRYTVQIRYRAGDDPAAASTSNLARFEVK